MSKHTFRDVAVTTLALGTAYGLGILTCVYLEVKLMADYASSKRKLNGDQDTDKD